MITRMEHLVPVNQVDARLPAYDCGWESGLGVGTEQEMRSAELA
jgi:hypothetical protein